MKGMSRLLPSILFVTSTTLTFLLFNVFGFMIITAGVILLLTTSYAVKYWREGVGAGLAYFGLAYVGFGLALLGIGLTSNSCGMYVSNRRLLPANAAVLLVLFQSCSELRFNDA